MTIADGTILTSTIQACLHLALRSTTARSSVVAAHSLTVVHVLQQLKSLITVRWLLALCTTCTATKEIVGHCPLKYEAT